MASREKPLPKAKEKAVTNATPAQRFFSRRIYLALFLLSTVLGVMSGLVVSYQGVFTSEAEQVSQLADYKPSLTSKVIADDGKTVIGEFALERRLPLSYDEIPLRMQQAIIAIEDSRFQQHWGVDPLGILRAGWRNFQAGATVEGGSTLTQQLAKRLFLTPKKSVERKVKELLLAIQIERQFTKQQIMELYCNQIFLGGGAYGVEAGAQYYFGKHIKDLALEEYALLAGIPKAPSTYARNVNKAKARRDLVLDKMAEEQFITVSEAEAAKRRPVKYNITRQTNNNSPYGYFVEEVRQYLEENYGTRKAHTSGLQVFTTLDAEAQRYAVQAVRRGLHQYDHRHPRWRGEFYNVIDSEKVKNLATYRHLDWQQEITEGMFLPGLVMDVAGDTAEIKISNYTGKLTLKELAWLNVKGKTLKQLLKIGDLVICRIKKLNSESKELQLGFEQLPAVNGAFVCMDVATGAVKVMVGGYDFSQSKFNNATQGNRQTGSVFKPFIYSAAIENGWLADETIADTPVSFGEWAPHNYDGGFMGAIALRKALAQSRNVPAVKLLNAVGIKKGVEIVKRFGITNKMAPYLPSALGATEVPLIEMVAAYCTFPNAGMRPAPFYIRRITDSEGRLLEERQPELNKAISPYVAATMVSMMEGVVQSGTAARIKADADLAKWPIAGKTGTVNDFTDAWFIGYTPEVAAGFWVGYPGEKRTLGEGETGAEAALPVWIDFMKYYIKERPIVKFPETPKPEAEIARLQEKRRKQQEININLNAIGADALPDNGEMLLNNNNLSQPDPDLPPPPPPPKRPLVFEGEEEEDGG